MWPTLAVCGVIITFAGVLFLLFGPLGIMLLVAGPIMTVAGILLKEPNPQKPDDPTKKFCGYCNAEIDMEVSQCPECGFPCD
ncbi:MAG: hypothetical protein FJ358_01770 [Thaumarchaeota archaeon]|nr:hypothetical protein [Nitrososphaerota archaeon]